MSESYTEIDHLREQLEYERRQRYAAEIALEETLEVRRSERPGQFATDELENERWQS